MEVENFKKLDAYSSSIYGKIDAWVANNLSFDYYKSFKLSISNNQILCKKWLIEKLQSCNTIFNDQHKLRIEIVGGWFGFPLIELLYNLYGPKIEQIDYYDIDENCHKILWQYIHHFNPQFKISIFHDYFERQERRRRDIVINTSQEHMPYITCNSNCYKNSPIYILQSNDMFELEEHTNCVDFEEELTVKSGLTQILYSGSLELEDYTRFMVIGKL